MDGNSLNESISLLELLHLSQYQDKFVEYNINARTLDHLVNRPKSLLNKFMPDDDIAKLRNKLKDETKDPTCCNEQAQKTDSPKDSVTRRVDITSDSGSKTANAFGQTFRKLKESFRKLKKPTKVREYRDDASTISFFREILSKQLNLVTIGETDEGKLETLKSTLLLSKEDNGSFSEGAGMVSVKGRTEEQTDDKNIQLTDSFGLFDSEKKESTILYKVGKAINMCSEGIHAILIVINGSRIFTDECRRVIDAVHEHFGPHFWNYATVIITGDELTTPEVQKSNLEYLCKIKILPEHSYEKRYIYVDNKNRAVQQVHDLLTTIIHNIHPHSRHQSFQYKVLLKAQAGIEAELHKAIEEVKANHEFVAFLFSPWRAILRSVILIESSDNNLSESVK